MQSVGTILMRAKTEYFRSLHHSLIVPILILTSLLIFLLPALASEAFATDPPQQTSPGAATAVASARVITPYTMNSGTPADALTRHSALTVEERISVRDCNTLFDTRTYGDAKASCELRLTELQ